MDLFDKSLLLGHGLGVEGQLVGLLMVKVAHDVAEGAAGFKAEKEKVGALIVGEALAFLAAVACQVYGLIAAVGKDLFELREGSVFGKQVFQLDAECLGAVVVGIHDGADHIFGRRILHHGAKQWLLIRKKCWFHISSFQLGNK